MQKSFWSNWFKPTTAAGNRKWTLEELGELYDVLLRNGARTQLQCSVPPFGTALAGMMRPAVNLAQQLEYHTSSRQCTTATGVVCGTVCANNSAPPKNSPGSPTLPPQLSRFEPQHLMLSCALRAQVLSRSRTVQWWWRPSAPSQVCMCL